MRGRRVDLPVARALQAIKENDGNITRAAHKLEIGVNTLRRILNEGEILNVLDDKEDNSAKNRILRALGRGQPLDLNKIAEEAKLTRGGSLDLLESLITEGHNLARSGDLWSMATVPKQAFADGSTLTYKSDKDNTFTFGVISDTHLGSKYERLDALEDSYKRFKEAGITKVFHCGNYVDGEARFNWHDLHTHGMDAQITYLIEHYPRIPGIDTYAISGDDHEGWWGQRAGIEIGKHVEHMMRQAGRVDWHDLGFMEAHIDLVNINTGKSAVMAVVHPGGGSAYAESYAVQKTIETLDGGEKPAVALYGHWHKLLAGEYRNVWFVLVPSTKDQDPFMRKRRIRSVVGAGIIGLEQDPDTGAIIGMTPRLWRYFAKGYYSDRWSHASSVTLPQRSTK